LFEKLAEIKSLYYKLADGAVIVTAPNDHTLIFDA